MEQIEYKRELANLKKQDQKEKLEEVRRQHQQNMLKLQAKHFRMDAKQTLKKVSIDLTMN